MVHLRRFLADLSPQAMATGLLVALVGYASSVTVVIQGLRAVGASTDEIASALVVLGIAKGIVAIALSLWTRMPISIAWSTPGLALLAATGPVAGGFPAVVGAFILTGVLIALAGLWTRLGDLVAAIPKAIANAMLAGILLKLCLAPFLAIGQLPVVATIVLLTWLLVGRISKAAAVPGAVVVALVATIAAVPSGAYDGVSFTPRVIFVPPSLTWEAVVSIALPLFIVTMASQNITGLAVLSTFGYRPSSRTALLTTGLTSAATAPFASPTINLAAITAALAAGPDAHPNPSRRYIAAVFSGIGYAALAAIAGLTAAVVTRSAPILIEAVAGLALIGAFASALLGAVSDEKDRTSAALTFLVTASGLSLFGIGAAFWGLVVGLLVVSLERWAPNRR
jgi:benzoate membrane transport protein